MEWFNIQRTERKRPINVERAFNPLNYRVNYVVTVAILIKSQRGTTPSTRDRQYQVLVKMLGNRKFHTLYRSKLKFVWSPCKRIWCYLLKFSIRMSYGLLIPLLGVCSQEAFAHIYLRKTIKLSEAALLMIVPNKKQSKYPITVKKI